VGALTPPRSGTVHIHAIVVIHSLEGIAPYDALAAAWWKEARARRIQLATSELTLLGTLVRPLQIARQGAGSWLARDNGDVAGRLLSEGSRPCIQAQASLPGFLIPPVMRRAVRGQDGPDLAREVHPR